MLGEEALRAGECVASRGVNQILQSQPALLSTLGLPVVPCVPNISLHLRVRQDCRGPSSECLTQLS